MVNGIDIGNFKNNSKKQFRQAENKHINSVIQEGLDNNNYKLFWKYVKCKKQENIGVSPLKQKSNLLSDSKGRADILVEQFQSVFTKKTQTQSCQICPTELFQKWMKL